MRHRPQPLQFLAESAIELRSQFRIGSTIGKASEPRCLLDVAGQLPVTAEILLPGSGDRQAGFVVCDLSVNSQKFITYLNGADIIHQA